MLHLHILENMNMIRDKFETKKLIFNPILLNISKLYFNLNF